MTDDDTLRTRIRDIAHGVLVKPFGHAPTAARFCADEIADTLILELPELQPCPFCGLSHYECDCLRKDATDWKATE